MRPPRDVEHLDSPDGPDEQDPKDLIRKLLGIDGDKPKDGKGSAVDPFRGK